MSDQFGGLVSVHHHACVPDRHNT